MRSGNELPAPVMGWIFNHSVKNYWRVARWYDLDDLVNDGVMKAYECRQRYGVPGGPDCPECGSNKIRIRLDGKWKQQNCRECGTRIIDPPHFMALTKKAFTNHITELVRKKLAVDDITVRSCEAAALDESESDYLARVSQPEIAEHDLALLIADLPDRLRRVVEFYLYDDPKKLWRNLRSRLDGNDETLQSRLHRLTGFPEDADFENELRTWLWQQRAEII